MIQDGFEFSLFDLGLYGKDRGFGLAFITINDRSLFMMDYNPYAEKKLQFNGFFRL